MIFSIEDVDAGRVDLSDVTSGLILPPVHPGEMLRDDFLVPLKLGVEPLARELGVPALGDVVDGRSAVTYDIASRLGRRFDTSPEYWMNLQARYDFDVARDRKDVSAFVENLEEKPGRALFDPWRDRDAENDDSDEAPAIRRDQLIHYLTARRGHARYLLVAEAAGYQGAHFTGIAMTSERILLGHLKDRGVLPRHVLPGLEPRRTSAARRCGSASVRRMGFSEPTATMVWSAMAALGADPREFVLWNAVPWHPFREGEGMLTNRPPTPRERDAARPHLERFLALFPGARRIAVGNVARDLLADHGGASHVRHPANGGGGAFRRGMAHALEDAEAR